MEFQGRAQRGPTLTRRCGQNAIRTTGAARWGQSRPTDSPSTALRAPSPRLGEEGRDEGETGWRFGRRAVGFVIPCRNTRPRSNAALPWAVKMTKFFASNYGSNARTNTIMRQIDATRSRIDAPGTILDPTKPRIAPTGARTNPTGAIPGTTGTMIDPTRSRIGPTGAILHPPEALPEPTWPMTSTTKARIGATDAGIDATEPALEPSERGLLPIEVRLEAADLQWIHSCRSASMGSRAAAREAG